MSRPTMRITIGTCGMAARALLALLAALVPVLSGQQALAHQDPPGCSATGVALMVEKFRADQQTRLLAGEPVTECETISFRVIVAKKERAGVCALEQGTLTLTTPDGVVHDLTPRDVGTGASLIPCLGGTSPDPGLIAPWGQCDPSSTEFMSDFVDYQIREADAVAGVAVALARYEHGLLHINPSNLPDGAGATTPLGALVERCPEDTACAASFCDPAAADGTRLGLCSVTNFDDSTPCADVDQNECTTAGCEAGLCVQNHLVVDCSGACETGVCDPATGTCILEPDSTPCADTDGDECTTAGCQAGLCVQTHLATDCSAECETGSCDPATGVCLLKADGSPCADLDETLCTIAGCEAGLCIQDYLVADDPALPDCGPVPTEPCTVTVNAPAGSFGDLQSAIDAADDGATITVAGLCPGSVVIDERADLTIEGAAPSSGVCPPVETLPEELTAAVTSTDGTVFKIRDSQNILVRFLKIVNGPGDCVKFTRSVASTLECSCVSGCADAGVVLNDSRMNEVQRNLVKKQGRDGIVSLGGSSQNALLDNIIEFNRDDGVDLEADETEVIGNAVKANGADGIDMDFADDNRVIANTVESNGCIPTDSTDSQIEIRESDRNELDSNVDGAGALVEVNCRSGSDDNFGNNLPPGSPCR